VKGWNRAQGGEAAKPRAPGDEDFDDMLARYEQAASALVRGG